MKFIELMCNLPWFSETVKRMHTANGVQFTLPNFGYIRFDCGSDCI